jgi:hypothetical protein
MRFEILQQRIKTGWHKLITIDEPKITHDGYLVYGLINRYFSGERDVFFICGWDTLNFTFEFLNK